MKKNIMKKLTYGRQGASYTRWWLSTRPSRLQTTLLWLEKLLMVRSKEFQKGILRICSR
jgi:hypothetical protein